MPQEYQTKWFNYSTSQLDIQSGIITFYGVVLLQDLGKPGFGMGEEFGSAWIDVKLGYIEFRRNPIDVIDHELHCFNLTLTPYVDREKPETIEKRRQAADAWAKAYVDKNRNLNISTTPAERALKVLVLTDKSVTFLAQHDPMALKQAQEALDGTSWKDYIKP